MFKFLKKIFGKKSKVQEEVKETTVVSDCEGCTCDCDVCCSEEVVSEVEQPNEEVVEVTEKAEGDDLYLKLKKGDLEFTFCVEAYLRDATTEVYKTVKSLQDHIDALNNDNYTLKQEIRRVEELGVDKLVLHPGSHVGLGIDVGLKNIIDSLNQLLYAPTASSP